VTSVLGLDIGGSSTRARLVVDGQIAAEVMGASASLTAAGRQRASAALGDVLAQLPDLDGGLDAVCAGAAGLLTAAETHEFLVSSLAPLTASGRVLVVDDASLILPAAGLTDGIAVICGTGSIAVGSWHGRREWAGGFGYLLGDEGSGYWIVRTAIRSLLDRRGRGLPGGELSACLLGASGSPDLDALRAAFYARPAPRGWARYAPAVLDCQDPAADGLARAAATALADLAVLASERLAAPAGLPVVLAGGLMAHPGLRAAATAAVTAALPASSVQLLTEPPVAGAVRLATVAAAS
jgi:glucosamine kinase